MYKFRMYKLKNLIGGGGLNISEWRNQKPKDSEGNSIKVIYRLFSEVGSAAPPNMEQTLFIVFKKMGPILNGRYLMGIGILEVVLEVVLGRPLECIFTFTSTRLSTFGKKIYFQLEEVESLYIITEDNIGMIMEIQSKLNEEEVKILIEGIKKKGKEEMYLAIHRFYMDKLMLPNIDNIPEFKKEFLTNGKYINRIRARRSIASMDNIEHIGCDISNNGDTYEYVFEYTIYYNGDSFNRKKIVYIGRIDKNTLEITEDRQIKMI